MKKIYCLGVSWYAPACLSDRYLISMNGSAWKEQLFEDAVTVTGKLAVHRLLRRQSGPGGLELYLELCDNKMQIAKICGEVKPPVD